MLKKVPANREESPKEDDTPMGLSLFDRPLASGRVREEFTIYSYLTFKNIVIALGVVTFLVFLGSAVSVRLAVVSAMLTAFFVLMLMEAASRRHWEKDLLEQLQRMSMDYERLVRDVARNRNDMAGLRKKLSAAAGTVAYGYEKKPGEPVERQMIRMLAEQLSQLSEFSQEDAAAASAAEMVPVEAEAVIPNLKPGGEETLTEPQVLRVLKEAVRQNDRVVLFLQPIVALPQRKPRFYEMLSRLHVAPEVYLPAMRYVDVARKQDLMPVIDNLLLLRGLQIVRNTEEEGYNRAFFFNITGNTLNDPKFMGDLVEFIAQNRPLAPRLIFELAQKDIAGMGADVLPILSGLSKLGCRFSMDQVKSLSFDYAYLEARHIRFIKVDAAMIMKKLKEEGGLQRMKRLKGDLDREGVDLIVEKIETERQLLELLEVDIDYGQGYLFGKPALYGKK